MDKNSGWCCGIDFKKENSMKRIEFDLKWEDGCESGFTFYKKECENGVIEFYSWECDDVYLRVDRDGKIVFVCEEKGNEKVIERLKEFV